MLFDSKPFFLRPHDSFTAASYRCFQVFGSWGDISYSFQETQLEPTVQPPKDDSPDQENIPDSPSWENAKGSSCRKSGQAQKFEFYGHLPSPSHEWLSHRCISDQWGKVGGVEEWRQSWLFTVIMFSASGPGFIRRQFHRFFQKYPAQGFLPLLSGLSLISLAPKSCSLHPSIGIEPVDIFRKGSDYPVPTFSLHLFRSNPHLKFEFKPVTSEGKGSGFWAEGTF